jgi:hypothetical protein
MTVHVLPMISQPLDQEWPGPVVLRRFHAYHLHARTDAATAIATASASAS